MKLSNRHTDESEAAAYLGLEVATLRDWRIRKIGPVYCKFGRAVRYPVTELEKYADNARVQMAQMATACNVNALAARLRPSA